MAKSDTDSILFLLPSEILGVVIGHVEDVADLKACAIVCRDMLPHAQSRLWRSVTLGQKADLEAIMDFLDRASYLADYIRRLRILNTPYWFIDATPSVPEYQRRYMDPVECPDLTPFLSRLPALDELAFEDASLEYKPDWSHALSPTHLTPLTTSPSLKNVSVLTMTGTGFESFEAFLELVCSLPRLQVLNMERIITYYDDKFEDENPQDPRFSLTNLQQIVHCPWKYDHFQFSCTLYRFLAARPCIPLRRLVVRSSQSLHWRTLGSVIEQHPQLEHLTISTINPLHPPDPLSTFVNLGRCTNLRSLALCRSVKGSYIRPRCTTWISEVLASVNSPLLEEVTITFETDTSYIHSLCWQDIDTVLADSEKLPRLRKVTIVPYAEDENPEHYAFFIAAQRALLPRSSDRLGSSLSTTPQENDF
ncbi:hypothetical protein PUNSTDRAFT_143587 [Punctularia strigosozonata HHB-11173 SS5]|uniref:uncharacterized protein n=1 Tax=Punctularia strigosozonata (strain HHB-11173) TaxID=741275 RepID=UPI0004417558|nr:uncharacterized protein PUNSTDRAFT_143587 [Punctularia strigosozonata HHB-11173 SS5]EIN08899.1 hypothetical protein PUNSTDRAFT_143587 [Punctularia strigosozonata HHB-11173 SS5]